MSKRHAIKLSNELIAAWEEAVLGLARLPKGFKKAESTRGQAVGAVLRSELSEVRRLWEIFTQERADLGKFLVANKVQAIAYLLGFHLPNAARMQMALARVESRYAVGEMLKAHTGMIRWHDLGAGSGAMTHAFLDFARQQGLDPKAIEAHATDVSGNLLDAVNLIAGAMAPDVTMKTHRAGLETLPTERFAHDGKDIVSIYALGYVFNELGKNARARHKVEQILGNHAAKGEAALVYVLEPATQDLCRAAMEWRDGFVANGFTPLYPCPGAIPCPMLDRSRDWCYSEGEFLRPLPVQTVDRALKIDRSRFGSTIFALATPAFLSRVKARAANVAAVVGRPEKGPAQAVRVKGPVAPREFDYLVCTTTGLQKVPHDPGKDVLPRGAPAPLKA